MTVNQLRHAVSPYLLQHKDNPVHWWMWGPAALAEARATAKPILLSVGYAACHWCHVMAHESFEDPATAAVMNRLFVNIKVDREERPDIDQIYMAALHALGEQGGWPLTMFLTPEGKPIWGGTYFPKEARYGRPAFVDVLTEVSRVYRERPEQITHNRDLLMDALNGPTRSTTSAAIVDGALLDKAAARLLQLIDLRHGGTRGAPKFPQPGLIELLWRAGERTQDPQYRDAALLTLRNIAQGGIYDHIGGGFARYSVDDRWLVPHFEKMLYDNAQLLDLMTYAHLQTDESLFQARVDETIGWLLREMRTPSGAFASSLDADSEGHEGRYYVWTLQEVISLLGRDDGGFFAQAYDITESGNWEGVSIPNRLAAHGPPVQGEAARLAGLRQRLLHHRSNRTRPALDNKILADWNGLAIAAVAHAGAAFRRPDWIEVAASAYRFISESMAVDGRLGHAWRSGKLIFPGLATDHAAMVGAAIALHQATFDAAYLIQAEAFAATLRRHHWDSASPGYYLTADDAEALIIRPRSSTDEATPSVNSMMAANLTRLWHLTGRIAYRDDADALIEASSPAIADNLFAVTGILNALDLRLHAVDVTIVSPADSDPSPLVATARKNSTPNVVLSVYENTEDLPARHPAKGKSADSRHPIAFVCRGETCSLPVATSGELEALIRPTSTR